ncbi:MAG: ArnT family glycosyltransferase, partial [Solirubrobacterales bacterium]
MEPRDLEPVYGRGPTILLWSAAILCTVCFLGARGLWGAEDRWAEIAREMRLTGDYFHPRLNGEAYFDKPLLTYWLILPAAAIAGRLDEAVARAPSVVAGLIALGATMSLARRLGTARQGRTAGWILLSMLGFLFWARTAEADMENLAAIILAVAWYWARRDKPGFVSYVVFYVICFVGSQTKGMAAIALPILLVLPDVLKGQRWRSYLSVSHALAILVGLAVYVMPLVYAETTRTGYQQSGLYMAFKENIVRYFRPFDHKEPFYVYLGYVPELVFPWTPLFVAAVWTAITTFRRCDWPGQWLSLSILLVFLFFTLSGSRRSYYILPILPFVAIQISRFFDGAGDDKWTRLAFAVQAWLLGAVAIFEILSVAIWPLLKNRIGFVASRDLVLVTPILGLLAILSLALGRGRPLLQSR